MTSSTHEKRLLGFDMLRLLSMVAIVVFHFNEAVFWTDVNPIESSLYAYRYILAFSQWITFSGFTVIAISFFLLGRGRRTNFFSLLAFLGLGIFMVAAYQGDPPFQNFYWEWDIYSFLLVSVLTVQALTSIPRRWWPWLMGFAFAFTWLPFWRWLPNGSGFVAQALVGVCPPLGGGSWPLLPWIAWPILFFSWGASIKYSDRWKNLMGGFHTAEGLLWFVLLGLSLPLYGAFTMVPIGPHFYCHTLRIEPVLFWATLIWMVFLMRLSLIQKVNYWLSQKSMVLAISDLRWNRRFGLSYLTHLFLLGLAIYFKEAFFQHPWVFDLYFIGILPTTEFLVRAQERCVSVFRRHNGIGLE